MKTFKEVLDSVIKSNAENDNHQKNKDLNKSNVAKTICFDYSYRPYKKS